MPPTRSVKQTVQARVAKDAAFRSALLREGIEAMLAGDVETGKAIVRDTIKAAVGFETLGVRTGVSPKSLLNQLQKQTRVRIQVQAAR
jgi:hypothetical protein